MGNYFHLVAITKGWLKPYLQNVYPRKRLGHSNNKGCCLRTLPNSFPERPLASGMRRDNYV